MKYLDNLDEVIFNLILKFKLDGIVRKAVYSWRIKWLRDLIARFHKMYRVQKEYNKLKRYQSITSETQTDNSYEIYSRMDYLKSKYNYLLKFWFMDKI